MASPTVFRNWSGLVSSRPRAVYRPSSLEELRRAVTSAGTVRLVGTGHSFNACAAGADTLVHTDGLQRVLSFDPARRLVKVEAGLKLKTLNPWLEERGLALPSLGDIAEQAMGGLVSTGTHGTGLEWGSFSDARSLVALELVRADGSVVELSADRPSDAPALEAARLGLGALGALYSLTFRVVDAHSLVFTSRVVSLAEALDPEAPRRHDHYEFFTFPFQNRVQVLTRDRTEAPARTPGLAAWLNDVLLENYALAALLRVASWNPSWTPGIMGLMTALAGSESFVGRSHEVMTAVRRVKFYEMEYAFAPEVIGDALAAYHDVNRSFAARTDSSRYFASFPGEVRFMDGDQGTLLSATLGRPSAFLAAHASPHFGPGYEAYFRALEAEFRSLGGRPHWGKLFYRNPLVSYPRFAEWNRLRQDWDPQGKWLNPYLQTLLDGRDL